MKLKKRFISALLTVCMCFSTFTPQAFAADDYSGHWAEESIRRVMDDGWLHEGVTESYRPNEYITRAEFVDMINRMMGYSGTGNMSDVTDVNAGDWYYESFAIALANGYISGYGDGTMRPNDPITRAQAFSIFSRISELNTANDNSVLAEGIADWDTVPDWGRDSVLAAIAEGFVSGNGDGTIAGDQFITRAESASLLSNKNDNIRTFAIPGQYTPTNAGSIIVSGSDITVEVPANTQLSSAKVAPNSVNAHIIIREGGHVADLSVERGATGTVIDVEGGTTVDTATINGPTDLSVKNGSTLNTLNVGAGADGTKVATEEGSNINTANISTPAEISGGGSIGRANIKSNGVVVESKPGTTEVDRGLSANVGSETVRGSTPSSSNSGGSSSGGSSSSGNNSGGNQTNYGRVTFNSNGGSAVASVGVVLGRVLSRPADPTKEGYTFVGWYSDEALGTAWNFTTGVVRRNITLYARWTENAPSKTEWTVTFESNGGSAVSTVEVVKGGLIDEKDAPAPTMAGYTFEGWYADKELTDLWDFATDKVIQNMTLYAKWTKKDATETKWTVTFDLNDGSKVSTEVVVEGEPVSKPKEPTREGYTFEGWYEDKEFTDPWDFATGVTKNITLYAKWTEKQADPTRYTVTFDSNEGSAVQPLKTMENGRVNKPEDPTRVGYKFEAWCSDEALEKVWNFATDRATQDMTLYAKWTEEQAGATKYKVTFDSNEGSYVAPLEVMKDEHINKPDDPTKNGFTFEGWYSDEDLNVLWDFATDKVTNHMTLYAGWGAAEMTGIYLNKTKATLTVDGSTSLAVIFEPNGAAYESIDWESGDPSTVTVSADPDDETKAAVSARAVTSEPVTVTVEVTPANGDPFTAACEITVVAQAIPVEEVRITSPAAITVEFGNDGDKGGAIGVEYKPENATDVNLVWTSSDDSTVSVDPDSGELTVHKAGEVTITVTDPDSGKSDSITVTAKEADEGFYKVTFNTNGGSAVGLLEVEKGDHINEPTAPTREGFKFGGWYSDEKFEDAWNFETDTVTGDMTLYAVWMVKVTFETNGGSAVDPLYVIEGGRINEPDVPPTKPDNTFAGWYSDVELKIPWNFEEERPTKDIKLFAKWTANSGEVSGLNGVYEITVSNTAPSGDGLSSGSAVLVKSGETSTLYYKNADEAMGSLVLSGADAALLTALAVEGAASPNKATFATTTDATSGTVTKITAVEIVDSGDGTVDLSALDLTDVSVTLSGGDLDLPGDKTEFTLAGAALLSATKEGTDTAAELTTDSNQGVTVKIDSTTGKLTVVSAPGNLTAEDPTVFVGTGTTWNAVYSVKITVDKVTDEVIDDASVEVTDEAIEEAVEDASVEVTD